MQPSVPDAAKARRLAVLDSYQVLNTPPEQVYDDLASIAASICACPVGMVNFVGANQVFFKSHVGMPPEVERYPFDTPETKNASFCVNLINSEEALYTVHDALEQPGYLFCSFVSCPNGIRFYAGASGEHLGSLCVIDYTPRTLTAEQNEALVRLARQVVSNLELRKTNLQLTRLVEEKNSFLGMISHDLRQPLCSIQVCTELLLRDTPGQEQIELVESIFSSSSMMLQLTNRLLRVAKANSATDSSVLDTTRTVGERTSNLSRLLGRVVATNARLARGKQVEVVMMDVHDENQPSMSVVMESVALEQVMNNILSNAVKFSPSNTRITVTVQKTSTSATVSVTDQGPGIPAQEHEKMWQPFRSTSVLPSAGEVSTGLGLYIAKRLVERHQGSITCESTVGKGTTFRITLNLAPDEAPASPKRGSAKGDLVMLPSGKRARRTPQQLTILVADDDALNRRILQSLFTRSGHTCTTVTNGQEAYDAVKQNPSKYHAVLLDLLMPVMNGDKTAVLIQHLQPAPKIFLISGADVEELQAHVADLKLTGYFWKPFSASIVDDVERHCAPETEHL